MKEWIVVKVKIDVNTNTELSLRHVTSEHWIFLSTDIDIRGAGEFAP